MRPNELYDSFNELYSSFRSRSLKTMSYEIKRDRPTNFNENREQSLVIKNYSEEVNVKTLEKRMSKRDVYF